MSRQEDDNGLFSFTGADQNQRALDRSRIEGRLAAFDAGVKTELAPLQTAWDETIGFLRLAKPADMDYGPKQRHIYPSITTKHSLNVTTSWRFTNLYPPRAQDPVHLDILLETPLHGTFERKTPDDELLYTLWFLKEFSMFRDRAFRKSVLPLKSLLDVPVDDTDQLQRAAADELLDRARSMYVVVSQPESIGKGEKTWKISSPQNALTTLTGRYNNETAETALKVITLGLNDGACEDIETFDLYIQAAYYDAMGIKRETDTLNGVNALLQRNGK